jgi:PHD/YefM family antitoxin component YafN of YafNO toxin-antitoxin module
LINNAIKSTINRVLMTLHKIKYNEGKMSQITANDLKTKGITAIEAVLDEQEEAIISVRGHAKFVVMAMDHYNHLRECELEAALAESQRDIAAGRVIQESAAAHVARLLAQD